MITRSRERVKSAVQKATSTKSQLKTKTKTNTTLKPRSLNRKRSIRSEVKETVEKSFHVYSFSDTQPEERGAYPDSQKNPASRKRKTAVKSHPTSQKRSKRLIDTNDFSISPILVKSSSKTNKKKSFNSSRVSFSEDSIRCVQNELQEYRSTIKSYKQPFKPSNPVNSSTPQNQSVIAITLTKQLQPVVRCTKIDAGSPILQKKPIQTGLKSLSKENDSFGYHTDLSQQSNRQTNRGIDTNSHPGSTGKDEKLSRENSNKSNNRSWRKVMEQKIMEKEKRYMKELNDLNSFSLLIG